MRDGNAFCARQAGTSRSTVLQWLIAAMRPTRPDLVYLDLNKWIDLAHAEVGNEKGKQYSCALKVAEELVTEGRVIFPLSFAHFMEVGKIGNDDQRRTLARLMVRLSQGWFLASAGSLMMTELRRAVELHFQKTNCIRAALVLTRSLRKVFIDPKREARLGELDDSTFQNPMVLEKFIATARVNRTFVDTWQNFAERHESRRAICWDSTRAARKQAYCAIVTFGIQDRLSLALAEFGLGMDALRDLGPEGCVALLESVPILDVEINLHVERNEHRDRKIASNDDVDLGFLSLAVPHCHTVVTEKFWVAIVRRLKLDQKYRTAIGSDLNEILLGLRAAMP